MTEISRSSGKSRQILWLMGNVFIGYVGFCVGSGWYVGSKIRSELLKNSYKKFIKFYEVREEYFPFPIVTVHMNFLKFFNQKLSAYFKISPNWKNLFSKKWGHLVVKFSLDRVKDFELSFDGNIDPKQAFTLLKTIKNLSGTKLFLAASSLKNCIEGHHNIRFKNYTGSVHFNDKSERNNAWRFDFYKQKRLLSSGSLYYAINEPSVVRERSKTNLTSQLRFFFETDFFLMLYEISHFFKAPELFLNTLKLINTQDLKNIFFPVNFNIFFNGEVDSKECNALMIMAKETEKNAEHEKNNTKTEGQINERLRKKISDFVENLTKLAFKQDLIFEIGFADQGKAKASLRSEHHVEPKDLSVLRIFLDLNWENLLKYFEKKTPEHYKKVYDLLIAPISTLNKNKDIYKISTDLLLQYNRKNLTLQSIIVNDMSLPELVQKYFFYKNSSSILGNTK
ncbi:hypothetical protein P618_200903 [Holospora obtusa F1]|uniref:Uncharacterized protein n=1 Tax=Holospora obtusa F1 TaxID=1399147 RepID=W6TGF0_HOLOB|nr:hypothetical protein [Holospora obtusa]ETZ06930.1 hypothetical protein P618_200903 [Holospora obtusa F1]